MRLKLSFRTGLIVSLALNAFLLALLGGLLFHSRMPPPPPFTNLVVAAERIGAGLSPSDAALLRDAALRHVDSTRAEHRFLRGMPDRVAALLAAPVFDPTALRREFAEDSAAHHRIDAAVAEMMVEAASAMSPAGRAALGRWRPPPPPDDEAP